MCRELLLSVPDTFLQRLVLFLVVVFQRLGGGAILPFALKVFLEHEQLLMQDGVLRLHFLDGLAAPASPGCVTRRRSGSTYSLLQFK